MPLAFFPFTCEARGLSFCLHKQWTSHCTGHAGGKKNKHVSSKNGDDRADRNFLPKQKTQRHGHQKMAEMHQFMKILKLLRISKRQPMNGYFLSFNYSDDLSPPFCHLYKLRRFTFHCREIWFAFILVFTFVRIFVPIHLCALAFCFVMHKSGSNPYPFFFFLLKWQMHLSMV